jgi:phosphate transport system protein
MSTTDPGRRGPAPRSRPGHVVRHEPHAVPAGELRLEYLSGAQYAGAMPQQRQAFQRELDAIDAKVIDLFGLVVPDLAQATQALLSGTNEVAGALAEHGLIIGLLGPEIEELAQRAILLQAPVSSDLRFLLGALRIVPELERSHHLVVQIASRASHIGREDLSPRSRELVAQMGNLVTGKWHQAAGCWHQPSRAAAAVLAERDDHMEELHARLLAELASGRMALPVAIEMTLVAPCYEHLGDHAVSITRQAIYLERF